MAVLCFVIVYSACTLKVFGSEDEIENVVFRACACFQPCSTRVVPTKGYQGQEFFDFTEGKLPQRDNSKTMFRIGLFLAELFLETNEPKFKDVPNCKIASPARSARSGECGQEKRRCACVTQF